MESLEERVAAITDHYRELEAELSDPEIYADQRESSASLRSGLG